MNIIEKLGKARNTMILEFPFLSSNAIDDCLEIIKSHYISQILDKDQLDKDDLILLKDVSDTQQLYTQDNLVDLIVFMARISRERSHGANLLSKVFVPSDLYNKSGLTENWKYTVLGVPTVSSQLLDKDNMVIGVCKAKFKYTSPEFNVIIGTVRS